LQPARQVNAAVRDYRVGVVVFGQGTKRELQAATAIDPQGWALTYAEAALRCGKQAEEVEASLVSKGLQPAQAAAAVERCFALRFAAAERRRRLSVWCRWLNCVGALCVVIAGILAVSFREGWEAGLGSVCALLTPLPFIWFSEPFGRYLGWQFDRPTPGFFVALCGWLLLLIILAVVVAGIPEAPWF
jgi:hypothetical protein